MPPGAVHATRSAPGQALTGPSARSLQPRCDTCHVGVLSYGATHLVAKTAAGFTHSLPPDIACQIGMTASPAGADCVYWLAHCDNFQLDAVRERGLPPVPEFAPVLGFDRAPEPGFGSGLPRVAGCERLMESGLVPGFGPVLEEGQGLALRLETNSVLLQARIQARYNDCPVTTSGFADHALVPRAIPAPAETTAHADRSAPRPASAYRDRRSLSNLPRTKA